MKKPSKKFKDWINTEDTDTPVTIKIDNWQGGNDGDKISQKTLNEQTKKARENILSGKIVQINLDVRKNITADPNYLNYDKKSLKTNISNLNYVCQKGQINIISGLNIRRISIYGGHWDEVGFLTIKNCWIETLFIQEDTKSKIHIENCMIGQLQINENCIEDIHINKSAILALSCPPPHANNPFFGQVTIKENNYFAKKENEFKGQEYGSQYYANARYHLNQLHNIEAASIFHSAEMRLERPYLSLMPRIFSFIYGLLSNYGNSIARPFLWVIFMSLVSMAVFSEKTALVSIDDKNTPWVKEINDYCPTIKIPREKVIDKKIVSQPIILKEDVCWKRALWFSLEPIFNPLGIVTGSNKFSPASFGLILLHSIERIILIILIFFFILAIRRKFRLTN